MSQFDTLAEAYEETTRRFPFREHIEAHSLLDQIGPLDGLAVLDLGCGSGVYARRLRRLGAARAVGVDASAGMIEHAEKLERVEPLGVRYAAADASLGLGPDLSGAFDLVVGVYLTPYAATAEELTGIFRTARQALKPTGGRFVAAVLNPGHDRAPGYYQRYGFDIICEPDDEADGAPVDLSGSIDDHDFLLHGYRWSKPTHERALRAGGFSAATWVRPTLSDEGRRLHPEDYWARYLARPHALILEAGA
ncbi:class I SAM-dependent methyltransferase [Actinomadura citrea]|uniref:SAM-dependent methyltransferase n=1 Tax=Actinomadura citrea TaxID=46158 RepID=A0A7Y9G4B4_9ACTN|nr:class I SAM-dependent methyltransferase [Actinomadura citrea]NYE09750.1 SAM-dependent methyltransferase [Actinomadura citrea]